MNVALTVGSLDPRDGGPARTVPALGRALREHGVAARILSCRIGNDDRREGLSVPVALASYPSRASRVVWGAPFRRALLHEARAHDVEIIHDNGIWLQTNHAASSVARRLSLPLIVSPRGMLEPWSRSHRSLRKRIAWWAFQRRDLHRAAVIHATSEIELENLRALGFRQPIAMIPNGVELPPDEASDEPSDERVGEPAAKADRVALFLSRLHAKKGLPALVEAWAAARPRGWRVVVAGFDEPRHRNDIIAAARRLGVERDFTFVGAVDGDAKWRLYRSADLFVLPTASENFGVVVAEALASGLPVITTNRTPWQEMVTERCGWWIDFGAAPLAETLGHATALSDDERRAMGARGARWVRARFGWQSVADDMRAVYEWMLSGGPHPPTVRHA